MFVQTNVSCSVNEQLTSTTLPVSKHPLTTPLAVNLCSVFFANFVRRFLHMHEITSFMLLFFVDKFIIPRNIKFVDTKNKCSFYLPRNLAIFSR